MPKNFWGNFIFCFNNKNLKFILENYKMKCYNVKNA